MSKQETPLQMAERHVREGRERVVQQELVVALLRQEPFSQRRITAYHLLEIYRGTLQQSRDRLAFLKGEERVRNSSG
jgi:hypothetical protein